MAKGASILEVKGDAKAAEPVPETGRWTPVRCAYWRSLPEEQRREFERWVCEPHPGAPAPLPPGVDVSAFEAGHGQTAGADEIATGGRSKPPLQAD